MGQPVSLGNLFQWLTTLTVKNFFLTSNLNLPSFCLKLLSLVLSLQALVLPPKDRQPDCSTSTLQRFDFVLPDLYLLANKMPSYRAASPAICV